MEKGASAVYAAVTHGLLAGNAMEALHNSPIEKLFITDTVETQPIDFSEKIEVVSAAALFGGDDDAGPEAFGAGQFDGVARTGPTPRALPAEALGFLAGDRRPLLRAPGALTERQAVHGNCGHRGTP